MKKRLLLITNGYPFGESERSFLSSEVQALINHFDLFVMAPENQEPLLYSADGILGIERYRMTSFRENGSVSAFVCLFCVDTIAELFRYAKEKNFRNLLSGIKELLFYRYRALEMEQQIRRLVEREKIDIVYTYWCTECALGAVQVKKRKPELKVITRFHGYDLYEERAKLGWQPFRRELASNVDALCFACRHGYEYFLNRWGKQWEKKSHLCYLGSKPAQRILRTPKEKICLISCSNLIPLKRVELIVEGIARLSDEIKLEWHHFGDGTERAALEKLAEQELSHRENFTWKFWGHVPNHQLKDIYGTLQPDLIITTSSTEGGAPVSIQEAMAMGIPAIGTDVGGVPDLIIDGETGFLLPAAVTPEMVAGTIMKYHSLTQAQKQNMSDAAYAHWEKAFDAERNAQKMVVFLKEL